MTLVYALGGISALACAWTFAAVRRVSLPGVAALLAAAAGVAVGWSTGAWMPALGGSAVAAGAIAAGVTLSAISRGTVEERVAANWTGVVDARAEAASWRVAGVPLWIRAARALRHAGIRDVVVIGPERPVPRYDRPLRFADSFDPPGDAIRVDASWAIDHHAIGLLMAAPPGSRLGAAATRVPDGPGGELDLSGVYEREQRRTLDVAPIPVRSPADARAAFWTLIRRSQKRVQDLPAEFLDPPFENAITWLLMHTPVTPNGVTYACLAIAAAIGVLFLQGWFVLGAALTYLVEWLDGVDGKLARTQLRFSKIGSFDSAFDYAYETFWWISITVAVARTAGFGAVQAGCLLLACDLACNILYTIGHLRLRVSLDEFGAFDRAFRRIGGRRNIYGAMFLIGFLLGRPYGTLWGVAAWSAVTVLVLTVRTAQNWGRFRK